MICRILMFMWSFGSPVWANDRELRSPLILATAGTMQTSAVIHDLDSLYFALRVACAL